MEKKKVEEAEEAEEGEESPGEKREVKRVDLKKGTPVVPKETAEDLMPFPLNRSFRSQSVLSDELKEEIWKRVMEEGKGVRDVSAALGVEMRRVAAVVRLKGVEKEWEKQVRAQTHVDFIAYPEFLAFDDEKTNFD